MQVYQVRLFRRSLIGLIVLVSLAVLANYVQIWRRRSSIIKPDTNILSPELMRSVENIDHVGTENGVVKYHLRAKKLLQNRQGKELLEGIDANDLNPDGTERNHISSRTAEYDPDQKLAFLSGDVRLRLGKDVELRMESLHYDFKDQTGYSDDRLRLASSQATGTARGIRYDGAHRRVELLNEIAFIVHRSVRLPDGSTKAEDYQISSQQGYYSESEEIVRLTGAAHLVSGGGTLAGDRIEAAFTPDKRHLTSLVCQGNAIYQSTDQADVRTLQGERIEFGIGKASQALESILVQERASFSMHSPSGDQNLAASEIHVDLDPLKGLPTLIRSQSGVRFELAREGQRTEVAGDWLEAGFSPGTNVMESMYVRDHAKVKIAGGAAAPEELQAEEMRISFRNLQGRSAPVVLQADRSVQFVFPGGNAGGGDQIEVGRSLTATSLTLRYSESGDYLASGTASGGVTLSALPTAGASSPQIRSLRCDRAEFDFYPGENRPQNLSGDGHVQVLYRPSATPDGSAAAGESRTSSSRIRARFSQADGSPETVTQEGDFVYQDGTRTATSARCDYTAAQDTLVLSGNPNMTDAASSTSGDVIQYERKQKTLAVRRHVRSTLKSSAGKSQSLLTSGASSPSLVTADEMLYWTEQKKAHYSGSVYLLSTDSQLRSETLDIMDSGETVEAQGEVRHLILGLGQAILEKPAKTGTPAAATKDEKSKGSGQALIRSAKLQYSRAANSIHYSGSVFLDTENTKLWADSLDVFLDADGKSVQRAHAQGNLRITQPGREVKGAEADYFLTEGKIVVTGNAMFYDAIKKVSSSTPRLTFFTADDRILLGR